MDLEDLHDDDDVLDLEDELEGEEEPAGDDDGEGEDDEGAFIGFADEADDDEEAPPLVKTLREQIRERDRLISVLRKQGPREESESDPEPAIPPRKSLEEFDYDQSRLDAYDDQRDAARDQHTEWKVRQATREAKREKAAADQAKLIEQQRKSLGVSDYEERAAAVKDRLSDEQLAVLVQAADNPARMIYALGRSANKLDQIASETNLAKLAALTGKLERDIKVSKRSAPAPETRVRGATAAVSVSNGDKTLARLEAEASKTGNRTKVIEYKRKLRAAGK